MKSTHHCFGFYVADGPVLDKCFYREILSWFDGKHCAVDTIGLEPYFRGIKQFSRMRAKVEALDLKNARELELNSHAEGAKNQLEDCKLKINLSQTAHTFALSGRTDILRRCPESLGLLRRVIERLRPEYGIAFTRNFSHGPIWYVWGIGCNETVSEMDQENLIGWANYGLKQKVWRHGQIRDVYPWNFLNETQLNAKVGKSTLDAWIRAKPSRGTLQPVGNLVLWDVAEEQISAIRLILWDAGVIFDYRPIEEERLRNAPPISEEEMMRWVLGGRKPEDVRVLKVEAPGKTRELSTDEVARFQRNTKK